MAKEGKFRLLVIDGREWMKHTKEADPQSLLNLLQPNCFTLVYVKKDPKHPERWKVAVLFDSTAEECKKVLDEIARKLGYVEGILDVKFVRKHIKANPLEKAL